MLAERIAPSVLFAIVALPLAASADDPPTPRLQGPIASSHFVGFEDPLSEDGAWVPPTRLSPIGSKFQKNFGAYPNSDIGFSIVSTTEAIPADHYSEIVIGHLAPRAWIGDSVVAPLVRIQASGSIDANYAWLNGNALWRMIAPKQGGVGLSWPLRFTDSPVADGDRLRLIARGPMLYGIKNGVREFIYNTGFDYSNPVLSGGTAGILARVPTGTTTLTDATIASWSAGAAPVSSGTWASSTFAGTENPLDEGDRWYPLPWLLVFQPLPRPSPPYKYSYKGFRKAGGLAIGLHWYHNASGVWSIAPPPTQYSEVTLGTVSRGGGGPLVRIDRNNHGQTGWLLFLSADNPTQSGIFMLTPNGVFGRVHTFAATIVAGDKWRLTAEGNILSAYRNGVFQFSYTTDGSYPAGDVGIEAYGEDFTFAAWEGGDIAGGTSPTIAGFTPTSGLAETSVVISGRNFTGATGVAFNGARASFTVTSDTSIEAEVPEDATTGPLSVTTPGGTPTTTSNFTVKETLIAMKAGKRGGTITANSGPINCGDTCWASYDHGTVVRLTATPSTGSTYTSWSGCDAVSEATCTVSMTESRLVTANFSHERRSDN
jgi:hypothetical protein